MSDKNIILVNLDDYMIQDEIIYDSKGSKISQKIYIDKKGERFVLKNGTLILAPRISYHNGIPAQFWPGITGVANGEQMHNTYKNQAQRIEDVPNLLNSLCPSCGYTRKKFPHECPPKAPQVGYGKL